jgi:putative peptidoglycan lipid II flippase
MPFFVAGSMTSYLALALGHYRVVSLRSTIQNSCLLIGTAAAAITGHSILLAWGFTVGCVVYSVYGTARVRQLGLLTTRSPWMGWAETAAHIKPMVLLVRGLLLIPVLVQLNEALERIVASFVGVRTVAATEYANFIIDTCVTLIAVPIGLAGLASLRDYSDIRGAVRLRVGALTPALLFAGLPMSVLLAFHARAVVGLLYGRGHFDTLSTLSTATLVQGFAIGLWAQLLGYVYIKVFSATLQTAKQVRAVALGMLAGMATMSVAIPSGRPIFIGLSGSVYGLVVTFVAAHEIGAVRMLGRWIGILLPGCVLMSVPAMLITGSGVVAFSVSSGISLAAWVGYCWAVPGTRAMLRGLRRGPAPGTVPAGDESVTNAQVKARSRR